MYRKDKARVLEYVKGVLGDYKVIVLLDNTGIINNNINYLRCVLYDNAAGVLFVKNTLLSIASSSLGYKAGVLGGDSSLSSSHAIAYSNDPFSLLQTLADFCKERDGLILNCCYYDRIMVDSDGLRQVLAVQSMQDLYAVLFSSLMNPMRRLRSLMEGAKGKTFAMLKEIESMKQ